VTRRVLASLLVLLLAGCTSSAPANKPSGPAGPTSASSPKPSRSVGSVDSGRVPRFAHIVVVVEENHAFSEVIGSPDAPYIDSLARTGTLLTNAYGITHPSEPNYLALFSGSTHGLHDDSCPHRFAGGNLAAQLIAHGQTFAGYSESLPQTGYAGCSAGSYARKHAPWTDFSTAPAGVSRPMSDFPTDYGSLPRVAFVVPNLDHDMHDGTVRQGDDWLRSHLAGYASWARAHDSLLIITWDEDDTSSDNHVPGLLVGAHVRQLHYGGRVDHYRMLRTIEAACGLPALGGARYRAPITTIWN
jgi:acid phosphatase